MMESLGEYLKSIREALNISLLEVYNRTNIDVTLLSRIEHSKRLPSKEQIKSLAKVYGCDERKLLVLLDRDKILYTLEGGPQYKLEVIQAVSDKIKSEKQTAETDASNLEDYQYYNLESRRYIGNKSKLTNWIMSIINEHTGGYDSFFDVFAGTASVSKAAIPHSTRIIMNDFLISNNIIYKAFFGAGTYDLRKLHRIVQEYNKLNPDNINDNYFSENFGDKFFDYKNSKIIGHIREDIETRKAELSNKEYAILLTSLIYSIDKIANTVGHFDAYIKKQIKYNPLTIRLIKPLEHDNVEIYQEDSNTLAERITADVAYIDPPYNSRQYSRFYHIYENLISWKKPELFGVAMKPKAENMSAYCTTNAPDAFKDLIQKLNVRYIVVSYNNTYDSKSGSSKNKITLEQIKDILEKRGNTYVYDCHHKCFNTGKTEFTDHKEILFITEVR